MGHGSKECRSAHHRTSGGTNNEFWKIFHRGIASTTNVFEAVGRPHIPQLGDFVDAPPPAQVLSRSDGDGRAAWALPMGGVTRSRPSQLLRPLCLGLTLLQQLELDQK
jgi:hypothetical protein